MKILILSDGKPGHVNQSIAFAKLKKLEFEIILLNNHLNFLTYILDFFHIYINLFNINIANKNYKAIVSAGSSTYYANKYLAKLLKAKSISIMLPRGFRYKDFDYILAQSHDNPPSKSNIIDIPINLSVSEPKNLIVKEKSKKSIGIIIGGNNHIFKMEKNKIKKMIENIFLKYPNYLIYITTSRRTPKEIDDLLENYDFDYKVIYSKSPDINPIPDFFTLCEELFITIDSTSMLSEAKANSNANLNIIDLESSQVDTKYHKLATTIKSIQGRIDLSHYVQKVQL